MISIEYLILFLVFASFASYLLTKLNSFLGSVVTIFSTMVVFISLIAYGLNGTLDANVHLLPALSFELTYLGIFFAIIVSFIYLMVSFFHPYFVDKYKYKNAYNSYSY